VEEEEEMKEEEEKEEEKEVEMKIGSNFCQIVSLYTMVPTMSYMLLYKQCECTKLQNY